MPNDHEQPVRPTGEYIREELKRRGWTQEDLARVLDRPIGRVNEIIQGRQSVSAEVAIALAIAFDMPPAIWMERESAYRLSLEGDRPKGDIQRRAKVYSIAPVKEMQKRGWIRSGDDIAQIEKDVAALYGVSDLSEEPVILGRFANPTPRTR